MKSTRRLIGAALTIAAAATGMLTACMSVLAADANAAAPATRPAAAGLDALNLPGLGKAAEVCQVVPDEHKFDRIGWSTTILAAEKLAKENGRPVFLFTHDGRINTGRC